MMCFGFPEKKCSFSTGQIEWSGKSGALKSHYKSNHRLQYRLEKWCSICKKLIRRRDTINHECFHGIHIRPTEEVLASFIYRFDKCNAFGCNSSKGLFNHLEAHTRADAIKTAAVSRAANTATPVEPPLSPSSPINNQDDNVNVSVDSNVSSTNSQISQIVEIIDDTINDDLEE